MLRLPSWFHSVASVGAVGLPILLLSGVVLAALGSAPEIDRAAAALYRRAEKTTPGTPPARELSRDFTDLGRKCLELREDGRAVELLEQAYVWDPDNGLVLAQLTLAYVRAENFPFARFYLELAEERVPRAPPEAYAVLGDVYYSLNRLEDAVHAWEQFVRLGGGPRILARLARVREELSLSSKQSHREIGGFVFYFDNAIPPQIVERLAESLMRSSRELSSFFQVTLPGPQVVILYAGRAYFGLISIPDWISGVFDGKIRVAIDPGGGAAPELAMVLEHELCHAYLRGVAGEHVPGWLHEGLAQWFEGKRFLRSELRETFAHSAVHTLSDMEGNLARRADRAAAQSNYVEALGLIEYLMQERGPGAVACLVRDLGDGATLEEALRREVGLSSDQLLKAWRLWCGLDR